MERNAFVADKNVNLLTFKVKEFGGLEGGGFITGRELNSRIDCLTKRLKDSDQRSCHLANFGIPFA